MMQRHTEVEAQTSAEPSPRYYVSQELAESAHRSLPYLIASRRCFSDQQADDSPPTPDSEIEPYIERIVEHCSTTADYLLPDTPLKEAVFRVILANGNEPMTPEEIYQTLKDKWAMTAYPRAIEPPIIKKLLDNSQSYCITQAQEDEDA